MEPSPYQVALKVTTKLDKGLARFGLTPKDIADADPKSLLSVYQRMAYDSLYETVKFGSLLPPRTPPVRSTWWRLLHRMRHRWNRLTSYRLVSMQDYSDRSYDW